MHKIRCWLDIYLKAFSNAYIGVQRSKSQEVSLRKVQRSLTIDIEWGSPLRVKDTSLTRRRAPCDKNPHNS